MKKQEFLSAVRWRINSEPTGTLRKMLMEFAQFIPGDDFDEALLTLKNNATAIAQNAPANLTAKVEQLCEDVENCKYELMWTCEDGYDDCGYYDNEVLVDSDGLGNEIESLLKGAMLCVEEKRYAEALGVFETLFSLDIPIDEMGGYGVMDLILEDLIELELTDLLRCYAYTALFILRGSKRPQKLYNIVNTLGCEMDLQEIAQTGADEIPQWDTFKKQWVEFLMEQGKPGHVYLLIDAVLFNGGVKNLHDFTIKHGTKYPSAYLRLTEAYIAQNEYAQAVSVILDGFSKFNGINDTRVRLADLLLDIGTITNDQSLTDQATWEGFYSSADLHHFLSIYNAADEKMKETALKYLKKALNASGDRNYIRFLCGEYEPLYNTCVSNKKSLGWSLSEKGEVIPLFVALLVGQEQISPCTAKLIRTTFFDSGIANTFFTALGKSFKTISDSEREKYMNWCLKETDKRAEAIIRGTYRNSYYKVSALIVSLAEALRAAGDREGAEAFIIGYKNKYPRHTAFRACLKEDIALAGFGTLF